MERHATAIWQGNLGEGGGSISVESGKLENETYSAKNRFDETNDGSGTNPEELLAAAHASCFAMQLSHFLAENGTPAKELQAKSVVMLDKGKTGFAIESSSLVLVGHVPGIDDARFQELAMKAKDDCPISKALGGVRISLDASLAAS